MTCRICGNSRQNTFYDVREMMLGWRESFTYFQCAQCHCLQIEAVPADLDRYYPDQYNGYDPPRTEYYAGLSGAFRKLRYEATLFPGGLVRQMVRALFPARQYQLLRQFGVQKDSTILDVGCGRGNYLYPLYALGMTSVRGIEPFIPATLTYPNGFTIEKGFASDARGSWDIILYNHSFEHVPDPLANLQAVRRLLKPNGVAIIRIPTVSSLAWEEYKTDWYQLDAPRHLFLHSVESMQLLAQQAGLTLSDVIDDSTEMQFLVSDLYRRDIPLVDRQKAIKGPLNYLTYKLARWNYAQKAKHANATRTGDQAAFIFRLPS